MLPEANLSKPKVSVIVSIMNDALGWIDAIQSALSQNYQNLEVLVVVDSEFKEITKSLNEIVARDSRLKVLHKPKIAGAGYFYKLLMKQASGKYVAALKMGNQWKPDYIRASLEALELEPAAVACFSRVQHVESENKKVNELALLAFEQASKMNQEELVCAFLAGRFPCEVSAVLSRETIGTLKNLSEYDQLPDWNLWMFLVLKGKILFLSELRPSNRAQDENIGVELESPTQFHLEWLQTRIELISSNEFVTFILRSQNPNETFSRVMEAYARGMDHEDSAHYEVLLYALRKNEVFLRDLPSFQSVLEMLFFYTGSIQKSYRYFIRHLGLGSCSQLFWKGFEWRVVVSRTVPRVKSSPSLLKIVACGPFSIHKVLIKKHFLPKIGFSFDTKSRTAERLLEEYFMTRQLSFVRRVALLLSSHGMGGIVEVARVIHKRILSV